MNRSVLKFGLIAALAIGIVTPLAAQELVCDLHPPEIVAAIEKAAEGNHQGAIVDLRILSNSNDPDMVMAVADVALEGLSEPDALRRPLPNLAQTALENALQLPGDHVGRALYKLSQQALDVLSEDKRNEFVRLSAALGNDGALIELARAQVNEADPSTSKRRLSLILQGGRRFQSANMTMFAIQQLDRGRFSDVAEIERPALVAEVIGFFERSFGNGRISAATSLASIYLNGYLVPTDIDKSEAWLRRVEPCWGGQEWIAMGRITLLRNAEDTETAAEYFRQAVAKGHVEAAVRLARLRTVKLAESVSTEEAVHWLERAVDVGNLEAWLIWVQAFELDDTFPSYDTLAIMRQLSLAERQWDGNGKTARIIAQLYEVEGTEWYSTNLSALWYSHAATANDPSGMVAYARIVQQTNPAEAIIWIQRAVGFGSASAMVEMSSVLLDGQPSTDDIKAAEGYLIRAKTMGSLSAVIALAKLYLDDAGPLYNMQEGENLLEIAVDRGSISAQTALAQRLLARAELVDAMQAAMLRDRAGRLLAKAAQKGNLSAMHLVANLILWETKNPQQVERAIGLLNRAYNGGRLSAMIDLASYYLSIGDFEHAIQSYQTAAANDSIKAMLELARAYSSGLGVRANAETSLEWLGKAEALGTQDAPTLRLLASSYIAGDYGRPDIGRGINMYRKAAALNDPSSMMHLATIYSEGILAPEDQALAVEWALKAGELGSVSAMVFVGEAYATGVGVEKDLATSLAWMERALRSNPESVTASLALGRAYEFGLGFEIEKAKAIAYYERAARLGSVSAMIRTARAYQRGIGIEPAPERAIAWYERAVRSNSVDAMQELAQMHSMGYGTPLDPGRAFELYIRAAEAGSTRGMREAALYLISGIGVVQDLPRAILLLETAANLNNTAAMRDLASLYGEGFEVERQEKLQLHWLRLAVDGGNHYANFELATIEFRKSGEITPAIRELLVYAASGGVENAAHWLTTIDDAINQETEQ